MLSHRRLSTLACLTALGAAGAIASPAATATAPGENGRIAFAKSLDEDQRHGPCRDHDDCVYTMRPDRSRLTPMAIGDHPTFSPSGKELAFSRENEGFGSDIFTIPAAGGRRQRVPRSGKNFGGPLAWSPDGGRLAFSINEEPFGIYSLDVRGRSFRRRLTRNLHGNDYIDDWSRHGALVFSSVQQETVTSCESIIHADLFTTASWGGAPRRLFPSISATSDGNWSPDGRRIVFSADEAWDASEHRGGDEYDCDDVGGENSVPAEDIYVARADGSRPRRLTKGGGHSPVWSPDGKKIAFVRDGHVWLMGADGRSERQLVQGHSPDWQPR